MATLAERLADYIRACFSGIWIETHEQADCLAEIAALCRHEHWPLASWDLERGLQSAGQIDAPANDPLTAIRAAAGLAAPEGAALLVLHNFHRFLQSLEIVQAMIHQLQAGKQSRVCLVVLAPVVAIPVELEKLFVVLEHALPAREQLAEIARSIATEAQELPTGDQFDRVLDAASGLTRLEAESAFALSLVRQGRIEPAALWELKAQLLKKSGLLRLYRGEETFADLGGLEAVKEFCTRALRPGRNPRVRPRGVLLLSPPGCGKSLLCKALGQEVGRPTLLLDIGALMGSLVGQTEQNIRQALRLADAMQPCVLFCDELDKGLAGAANSGPTDSGVATRLFGTLLTYLSDHESDVFFVATANSIARLPAEFTRAERFDAIYFLDLPGAAQRRAIWQLHLNKFGLDPSQPRPIDADWTGAEIHSCCRLAALLDVPLVDAAHRIVPVARTAAESIQELRRWASGRCLDAQAGGIYQA
ncbi:MAG: AAA family ATPase, partial [Pirellulales bacterium]|nr:AAA family ATPase [Pirellulales bacterium]